MNEKKYEIQATFNYSDEDMIDIISSAVYDIGYWGVIHNDTNEWWEARSEVTKDTTFEELMFHILKKGEQILILDREEMDDEDGEFWSLTLDNLMKGIKLTIENGYWDGDLDTIDGEVGDIIFQNALFDEIVFG